MKYPNSSVNREPYSKLRSVVRTMQKGDLIVYHNGKLVRLSPGTTGLQLVSQGSEQVPGWGIGSEE